MVICSTLFKLSLLRVAGHNSESRLGWELGTHGFQLSELLINSRSISLISDLVALTEAGASFQHKVTLTRRIFAGISNEKD